MPTFTVTDDKHSHGGCCSREEAANEDADPSSVQAIQDARDAMADQEGMLLDAEDGDPSVPETSKTPRSTVFSDRLLERLEHQQYRIIGNHSAVKTCGWTKNSIREEGNCYKNKFYGIRSHRCVQMTTYLTCANFCTFCWRDITAPPHQEFHGRPDDPAFIIEEAIKGQNKLLIGFKGDKAVNHQKWEESQFPKHFAISLTGEPVLYPRLQEMLDYIKSKGSTSYVVCSGQFPEQMSKLTPTQLYLSVDAPNEDLFYKIDRPTTDNGWGRLLESLDELKKANSRTRTTIRITLVKGHNMVDEKGWADLIARGDPLFVEIKGYMCVGSSQKRLTHDNMPTHDEIRAFADEIGRHCGYRFIDEQKASRVVLFMKEDFEGRIMKFDDE